MKKELIFSLCLISNSLWAQTKFVDTFNWNTVKTSAQSENKIIFVDLYASWCSPCKRMDKFVYTNDTVYKYLNDNFISLKIKIDSSENDNDGIKKMYPIASELKNKYHIKSLPAFLFMSPNGDLIHRGIGFQSVQEFIDMCKTAQNPEKNYAHQINDFLTGNLKNESLINFAIKLKNIGEDSLAIVVAKKYKEYGNKNTNTENILTKKNLSFLSSFTEIYTPNDKLVKYIFNHQEEADKIMNRKGFTESIINYLTFKYIVGPYLQPNGTYIEKAPSWHHLEQKISQTWNSETAQKITLESKLVWYENHQQWDSLIKYQFIKFDQLASKYEELEAANINNFIFDVILKRSNNQKVLEKSLQYMEKILNEYPKDHLAMDTYANILYKSGRKEQAIKTEEKAVFLAEAQDGKQDILLYKETIKKMESGQPTWK